MTVSGMYHEETIEIAASPGDVYDLVSDLPRMGEWSPENEGGEWVADGSGDVGDRFVGSNRSGDRQWSVPCKVTVASRPEEFEFVTGPDDGPYVRWSFRLEPSGSGTALCQVWDVEAIPPTLVGASADRLAARADSVRGAMALTLAALKATAES